MKPGREQPQSSPPAVSFTDSRTIVYLLTLLLPVFSLLALLTFYLYQQEAKSQIRVLSAMEEHHAQQIANTIEKNFDSVFSDLLYLANQKHALQLLTEEPTILRGEIETDYLLFSRSKKLYDQVRIIDRAGQEIIRVNYNAGEPAIVPPAKLQTKTHRYYVEECKNLGRNAIYLSPFDLNIENRQIELPRKPMIRLCTPVLSEANEPLGVVVLNYFGQKIIDDALAVVDIATASFWLVNAQGYWLKGRHPGEEWGFMHPKRKQQSIADSFPEEWQSISTQDTGQFISPAGMFTFTTITPFDLSKKFVLKKDLHTTYASNYKWKAITHIPREKLAGISQMILQRLFLIDLFVALALLAGALLLTRTRIRRDQALETLKLARAELETRVSERTETLSETISSLKKEVVKRGKAETQAHKAKQIWEETFNCLTDLITIHDPQMDISQANVATFEKLDLILGHQSNCDCRLSLQGCIGEHEICPAIIALRENTIVRREFYEPTLNAQIEIRAIPIPGKDNRPTGLVHVTRDISELRTLEEQIHQTHKMEAIGTLAGGIAHDFNNILSIMIGNAEMGQLKLPVDSPVKKHLKNLLQACDRAKNLVGQILSFSRKEGSEYQRLDPRTVITDSTDLLCSTLPSSIKLELEIADDLDQINANATQLHQVLMNLMTNAIQSMTHKGLTKGNLNLRVVQTTLTPADLHHRPRMSAGDYIQISVADSGNGIPPEILERIFDPFFTTKDVGEGTGLGLSLVHGIIEGHDGMITVDSAIGEGTRFDIYLPVARQNDSEPEKIAYEDAEFRGSEHILWVDDEVNIVDIGRSILEEAGYRVTTSTSSVEAQMLFAEHPDEYDLVITDMTMPECTGAELAKKLLATRPTLPIILCTGYSSAITTKRLEEIGIFSYYQKPLTRQEILLTVRTALQNHLTRQPGRPSDQGSTTPQVSSQKG